MSEQPVSEQPSSEKSSPERSLEALNLKVDRLIQHCERLHSRNLQLQSERDQLVETNEKAKTRVEAMISHLKQLLPASA